MFNLNNINAKQIYLVLFLFGIFIFHYMIFKSESLNQKIYKFKKCEITEYDMIFGDNITGYPYNIVPNIVHYVLFQIHEVEFGHLISILSVLKNQKPDKIIIHCDCNQLNGYYYNIAKKLSEKTNTAIIVREIVKPTEIFGIQLNKDWVNWHASDITRNRVLREFGGIYIDRDVYVVQSLDEFRKYEMTLNWDESQYLGTQVQIGHKNSRFLKRYLDSYHAYDSSKWYYNAGEYPTISILYKYPELVHRVKVKFGVDGPKVCPKVFREYYPNWKTEFYTIHLVLRGNEISFKDWCFGNNKPNVMKFDENIIKTLNVTFGEMTRLLFAYFKIAF